MSSFCRTLLLMMFCLFTTFVHGQVTSGVLKQSKLPTNSVYQMDGVFTDQDAHDFVLANRAGRVQLVAMFYTSCQYVCPLIVNSAKANLNALTAAERKELDVLLVSFDSARDTPTKLKAVALERKLDQQWTLARADKSTVRKLAALLNIRYRELQDGEFNHSSALVILDAQGRILGRTEQMGVPVDAEFLAKLRAALARQ
jgi:protein SCO1